MSKLSIHEHMVRAFIYADSPEKQQRVAAEASIKGPVGKMLMNQSYGFAYRHPNIMWRTLTAPYTMRGVEVLALGRNSTAIRDGDMVLKLARASKNMSPLERDRLVSELRWRHQVASDYLGEMCVDQVVEVVKHPLHGSEVVATRQQFVDFEAFDLNAKPTSQQHKPLFDLAQRSIKMDVETGLVSDVSGKDNFGFDTQGSLVFVDTIPLKASDGGPSIDYARRIIQEFSELAP